MVTGLIGKKIDQSQAFLEDGTRIPVTRLICDNIVVLQKQKDKDGYDAVQLGQGARKNSNKALIGHVKTSGLLHAAQVLREVELSDAEAPAVGTNIKATDVFKPGDLVDVIGVSKGKGYAGVVKRHHFKGGPRTHGQSDRERAPGSIGQTTTPGRVYKGKRMAGRMGSDKVTVKNLEVIEVEDSSLWVKGLVPGVRGGFVVIEKAQSVISGQAGAKKKFIPLYKPEVSKGDDKVSDVSEGESVENVQPEPTAQVQEEVKVTPQENPQEEVQAPQEPVQDESSKVSNAEAEVSDGEQVQPEVKEEKENAS